MTYTEEFIPGDQGSANQGATYPTLFGVTFTPKIGGIILALLGLGGAAYLMLNQVKPVWDKHQELENTLSTKQTELQQKQAKLKNIPAERAKLAEAKQQNKEVRALFYTEKQLNTFLLDINRFVSSRQASMKAFVPTAPTAVATTPANAVPNTANNAYSDMLTGNAEIVNDNSLGSQLNGKLIRKTVQVDLEGSFDQIQSVMRSIERLQQMLVIKDMKAALDTTTQSVAIDYQGKLLPVGQATTNIKTSFKLQALTPLTQEEASAAAAAPPPKK